MSSATQIRSPEEAALAEAAALLRRGELVAFPTETVYGLGADATQDRAVARIFEAKGRPRFNPLIVHLPDLAGAERLAVFNDRARAVAQAFWPGPLTLVLKRQTDCPVSLLCSAGLDTLALRVPGHPAALKLLETVQRPLAGPSANASGRISPTRAEHVVESLGDKVSLVLDGGACRVGLESTVLDLSQETPALLRPGAVTAADLEALTGPLSRPSPTVDDEAPRSPGQLASHYAPRHDLRLEASTVTGEEALLAFGPEPLPGAAVTLNLSPSGDLVEAAANLFNQLRALDRAAVTGIAAMPIPETGLGIAINDRLRRAAAPRDKF